MKQKLLISLLLAAAWGMQAKTIYYVKQGATGTGTSWATASGNIQAMVNGATVGDEVWVAQGTYYPTQAVTNASDPRDRSFVMRAGISLYGGFAGTETSTAQRELVDPTKKDSIGYCEFKYPTVLNGDIDNDDEWVYNATTYTWDVNYNRENAYHVVYYKPTEICETKFIFDGFTVKGGNTDGAAITSGGGIYNSIFNQSGIYYSKGIVQNCKVYYNASLAGGGGILNYGEVVNCKVYNNKASCGGGIYSRSAITKSDISNNTITNTDTSYGGGGIYAVVAVIKNCLIHDNKSAGKGGGVLLSGGSVLDSSEIYNNITTIVSYNGGGGVNIGDNSTLSNSLIYSNRSSSFGGGVSYDGGRAILENCRIFNNYSIYEGGGVQQMTGTFGERTTNCLIYNNVTENLNFDGSAVYNWSLGSFVNCTVVNNKVNSTPKPQITGNNVNCISGDISQPSNCILTGNTSVTTSFDNVKFVRPSTFVGLASTVAQLNELKNTDWHVQTGSLCIDTGTPLGANTYSGQSVIIPAKDMDNFPRPLGNGYDIGAYEYFSYNSLPFAEDFEGANMKFFSNNWIIKSLAGSNQEYYEGKSGVTNYSHELFSSYFSKPANGAITLSYDLNHKRSSSNTLEQLAVVILPLGATVGDTVVLHNNQNGNFISHFSYNRNIAATDQYFMLKFIAKGINAYNIYWWGVDNISLVANTNTALSSTTENNMTVFAYNGFLHFSNIKQGSTYEVYDISGILRDNGSLSSNFQKISLPQKGIYLVKVKSNDITETKKVIW
ncbi:MAG: T9SS type A sorting domain-containing protein [Paludibacter sp.]